MIVNLKKVDKKTVSKVFSFFSKTDFKIKDKTITIKSDRISDFVDNIPRIENFDNVKEVKLSVEESCPLTCRKENRGLPLKPIDFTRGSFVFIAGPCAVENEENYVATALALKKTGVDALRACIFKPRSSPYTFQGLGYAGLPVILKAKRLTGLPLVTEVNDCRQVEKIAGAVDVFQIGTRNMRNYELLKEVGKSKKPALLKRARYSSLKEWLLSSEYLLKYGAMTVILCERGDGVFPKDRHALNFKIMKQAISKTGLPVIVDPSHTGKTRNRVKRLALEAAGANTMGFLIEVNVSPETARIDGKQTLSIEDFSGLFKKINMHKGCLTLKDKF